MRDLEAELSLRPRNWLAIHRLELTLPGKASGG